MRERNLDQTMQRRVFGPAPARLIRMHNSVYTGSYSGPGTVQFCTWAYPPQCTCPTLCKLGFKLWSRGTSTGYRTVLPLASHTSLTSIKSHRSSRFYYGTRVLVVNAGDSLDFIRFDVTTDSLRSTWYQYIVQSLEYRYKWKRMYESVLSQAISNSTPRTVLCSLTRSNRYL